MGLTKTFTAAAAVLFSSLFVPAPARAGEGDEAKPSIEVQPPHGKFTSHFFAYGQPISGLQTAQERFDAEVEESLSSGSWSANFSARRAILEYAYRHTVELVRRGADSAQLAALQEHWPRKAAASVLP